MSSVQNSDSFIKPFVTELTTSSCVEVDPSQSTNTASSCASKGKRNCLKIKEVDLRISPLKTRMKVACFYSEYKPLKLAKYFLKTFTAEEIIDNWVFFENVINLCRQNIPYENKTQSYLEKIYLYLDFKKRQKEIQVLSNSEQSFNPFVNNGILWECIGEKEAHEGKDFIFKLKSEYDLFTHNKYSNDEKDLNDKVRLFEVIIKKQTEMFPAIEPGLERDSIIKQNKINEVANIKIKITKNPILSLLGYRFESNRSGLFITLPDSVALMSRWNALKTKEQYRHLPELTIASSVGVATHDEYIEAFKTHSALLATGSEFVHDHLFHLMPTLCLMNQQTEEYASLREKAIKVIERSGDLIKDYEEFFENDLNLEKIALIKIIKYSIGIFADRLATMHNLSLIEREIDSWITGDFFVKVWKNSFWRTSLTKMDIDNPEIFTAEKIKSFWAELRKKPN